MPVLWARSAWPPTRTSRSGIVNAPLHRVRAVPRPVLLRRRLGRSLGGPLRLQEPGGLPGAEAHAAALRHRRRTCTAARSPATAPTGPSRSPTRARPRSSPTWSSRTSRPIKAAKVDRWLVEWGDGASATNIGIPARSCVSELARRQPGHRPVAASARYRHGGYTDRRVLHRDTLDGLLYSERLEDLRTGDLCGTRCVSVEYVGEKSSASTSRWPIRDRPYAVVEDFLVHNCGKKNRGSSPRSARSSPPGARPMATALSWASSGSTSSSRSPTTPSTSRTHSATASSPTRPPTSRRTTRPSTWPRC